MHVSGSQSVFSTQKNTMCNVSSTIQAQEKGWEEAQQGKPDGWGAAGILVLE